VDGRKAQLVADHLELARRAAAAVYPRVRGRVALEDLIALANAGLAEAADRYDPARGVPFTAFAWYRVHGTIIDGLRKSSELPRRTWSRLVALRAANDHLERAAVPDPIGAFARAMAAVQRLELQSLEALRDRGFDTAGDAPARALADDIDLARTAARLRDAIDRLSDKQRAILVKHYWEGKNLLEAGAELGLSKSWASRLHAQAVDRLRALIDGPDRTPR
jgi:RNA polymerase sigma factor for flagellar operon FliA